MLERRTFGPPQQQLRQLQMLKGVYKTETCRYDANPNPSKRCNAGSMCCFRHSIDTEESISQMVNPIRQKVFRDLYEENFALPDDILHEIGKITDQEYDIRQERKEEYLAAAKKAGVQGPGDLYRQ